MKLQVFGQDKAINTIVDKILVARAGLKSLNKPVGSFLFLGFIFGQRLKLNEIITKLQRSLKDQTHSHPTRCAQALKTEGPRAAAKVPHFKRTVLRRY